jgi:hypothetical protein
MRRISFPLLLLASTLLFGTASANPSAPTVSRIAKLARASLVIPQDWDGIWAVEDSVYLCDGTFQSAPGSAPDTICGGSDYQASGPVTLDCNGTADATTISVTCTGSGVFIPDCNANYTVVTHGTRSGDSYFTVTTVDVTYTGAGCEGFPPQCTQVNSHGTRTGPAPAAGCAATPTRRSTWGEIKAIYR